MKKTILLLSFIILSLNTIVGQCPTLKNLPFIKNSIEGWVKYVEFGQQVQPTNIITRTIGWAYKSEYDFLVGLYINGKLTKVFPITVPSSDFTNIKGEILKDEELTAYMKKYNFVNILNCN